MSYFFLTSLEPSAGASGSGNAPGKHAQANQGGYVYASSKRPAAQMASSRKASPPRHPHHKPPLSATNTEIKKPRVDYHGPRVSNNVYIILISRVNINELQRRGSCTMYKQLPIHCRLTKCPRFVKLNPAVSISSYNS